MKKLVVLDGYCLNPGDLSWDALKQLVDVEVHDRTPAELVTKRAAGAELVMTNKTPLPAGVLRELTSLRYIGVLATGFNIIDTAAAHELGITVTNIPTYGTASVAQFVFALLLDLCHQAGTHSKAVRSGQWAISKDWSFWNSPLVELSGKTMGIIGFGRIGRQTARIADAMGMRVVAYDNNPVNPPAYEGFEWMPVDRLLKESDVVSLHCPLLPETQGFMNAARLATMKPTAFLINTSRGPLVVDKDLADALNNDVIAGAGLDVLSVEPPVNGNPLFTAKHCVITPHIAWATKEARGRLLDTAVENVRSYLSGAPVNCV
jgi:glycerate dehydrogenase